MQYVYFNWLFPAVLLLRLSRQLQVSFFLRKSFERKKSTKRESNNFSTLLEVLVRGQLLLCCLVFAYLCFVSWFLLDWHFCAIKYFLKKNKLIWNCLDNLNNNTTDVKRFLPHLLIFFVCGLIFICVNLFLSVKISFHLSKSLFIGENLFLFMIICESLFLTIIIYENLFFYLPKPTFICEHLFLSSRTFFFKSLWK